LELALKKCQFQQLQDGGLDFGDGGIPLSDLGFAMTFCYQLSGALHGAYTKWSSRNPWKRL